MDKEKLKFLVPNGITFLSLTMGFVSILASAQEYLILSGAMVFSSYWLDMMDGFSARKLKAQSDFGLQMDSLADMVSLGVAPALLVFQHLRLGGLNLLWIVPFVIVYTLAGGFRLARFNTLPPKTTSEQDSLGLTITQSGCTVAVAVLGDTLSPGGFLPLMVYFPLLAMLAILMTSRIPFPPSSWFFRTHKFGWALVAGLLSLLIILHIFSIWFITYIVYILISIGRFLNNRRQNS